ncbi:bifunctional lysylphosphatidylglycerol flippase/synthetase MprF [Brucella sp. 10RB9214]|uniref:bifunctional lysylphosphatidylglycerol flippase/synthetase MprF n=1 Tax=unclassified Brucella TaxID=2632610 RepID=UPI00097283A6|nr:MULTISPECIES: bifunctional lysylphosphatidylglycerol flippase/synthetase MprF [unclassified Brucella]APY15797.1 lysylphosphatidylglycerol synthetase [Brucella sp. 09RB8910]MRN45897.1 bifunctional lysylphosphatidylglycerol flippase/synthetase MprF [Brucella sp. 10RB9212]MRN50797.1 bifunctional lysylphosphatidylglycerol flippase/synthetase MprF [Brucella sp. 10RB9214]
MSLIDDEIPSSQPQVSGRHFGWLKQYQHFLFPIAGIAIALLAIYVLENLLRHTSRTETLAALHNISWTTLALAVFFTALSYAAVALYDVVAVDTIAPNQIPRRIAAVAGAAGYAISNALGFSLLTGGALRYRIYAAEGISLADIGKIVGTSWFAIWFALIIMVGAALLIDPQDVPFLSAIDIRIDIVAGILILGGIGWLIYWLSHGERNVSIGSFSLRLPNSKGALTQIFAGVVDVGAAAATLYVLLPEGAVPSFAVFALVYVIAIVLGIASHAPGGLGAFEATIIAGLGLGGKPDAIAGLLAYRLIYTVLPLVVATAGILIWEVMRRRHMLGKQARFAKRLVEPLVPGLSASIIFLGGIILLISGATPDMRYRVKLLSDIVPEFLVEMSHLAASLVGVALLIVARGLSKRLERAWVAAMVLLLCGAVFSIAKGLDWEEASILCLFALSLWGFRDSFYRRPIAGPFELSWNWIATVGTTVLVSTWLGFFVYRHIEYSSDLWWDFAWNGNAPRFLRATVLVFAVVAAVGLHSIINRHGQRRRKVDHSIPDAVPALVARCPHTDAALAMLGDKQFLLAPDDSAFIMYAQSGGSLIALGEPIGDATAGKELAWSFHSLADRLALRTVFYGVGPQSLPLFLDMGLIALKLGEVARVDLTDFSLEGPRRQPFRYADRKVDKDGLTFEIIPAADVPPLIPRLRAISDAWLDHKSGSEKGFSLGYFNDEYLKRFDIAVLKKDGEIVAFANIWRGADKYEITVDLMRYMPNVHKLLMDALFAKLLTFSKQEGYKWFNLGAAPLSGLSGSRLASRWNRFGSFIYRRGADLYHFDGLKAFKEKFDPVWTPHYMVCPGGLETPRALLDATTLINGSPLEFIRK